MSILGGTQKILGGLGNFATRMANDPNWNAVVARSGGRDPQQAHSYFSYKQDEKADQGLLGQIQQAQTPQEAQTLLGNLKTPEAQQQAKTIMAQLAEKEKQQANQNYISQYGAGLPDYMTSNPNLTANDVSGYLSAQSEPKSAPSGMQWNAAGTALEPIPGYMEAQTRLREAGATNIHNNIDTGKQQDVIQTQFGEQYVNLLKDAESAYTQTPMLDAAEATLSDPNLYTGLGGENVLKIKQVASALGMDMSGVPEAEMLNSLNNQMAVKLREAGSGPMSDKEQAMYKASVPGLGRTAEGNKMMIGVLRAMNNRKIALAEEASRYYSENGSFGADWLRYKREWLAAQPNMYEGVFEAQESNVVSWGDLPE